MDYNSFIYDRLIQQTVQYIGEDLHWNRIEQIEDWLQQWH